MASFKNQINLIRAGKPLQHTNILTEIDRFQNNDEVKIPKEHFRVLAQYFADDKNGAIDRRWIGMLLLKGLQHEHSALTQSDKAKRTEFSKSFVSVIRQPQVPQDLVVIAGRLLRLCLHHDKSLKSLPGLIVGGFPRELSSQWILQLDTWLSKQANGAYSENPRFWPVSVHLNTAHLTYKKYSEFFVTISNSNLTTITRGDKAIYFADIPLQNIKSIRILNSFVKDSPKHDQAHVFELEVNLNPERYIWNATQRVAGIVRFSFLKEIEAKQMRNALRETVFKEMDIRPKGNYKSKTIPQKGRFMTSGLLYSPDKPPPSLDNEGDELIIEHDGTNMVEDSFGNTLMPGESNSPSLHRSLKRKLEESAQTAEEEDEFDAARPPKHPRLLITGSGEDSAREHTNENSKEKSKARLQDREDVEDQSNARIQGSLGAENNLFSSDTEHEFNFPTKPRSEENNTNERFSKQSIEAGNETPSTIIRTPKTLLIESITRKPQLVGFGSNGPVNQGIESKDRVGKNDFGEMQKKAQSHRALQSFDIQDQPLESEPLSTVQVYNDGLKSSPKIIAPQRTLFEDPFPQLEDKENCVIRATTAPVETTPEHAVNNSKPLEVETVEAGTGSQLSRRVNAQGSPFPSNKQLPVQALPSSVFHGPDMDLAKENPSSNLVTFMERLRNVQTNPRPESKLLDSGKQNPQLEKTCVQGETEYQDNPTRSPAEPLPLNESDSSSSSQSEMEDASCGVDSTENHRLFPVPEKLREMQDTLIMISQRLLMQLSDKDVVLDAIAQSYEDGGRRLLDHLIKAHQQEAQSGLDQLQKSRQSLLESVNMGVMILENNARAVASSMNGLGKAMHRHKQVTSERMKSIDGMLAKLVSEA